MLPVNCRRDKIKQYKFFIIRVTVKDRQGEKMIVIVCLDDKNGMLFNRRRQSRDSVVTADIVKTAEGGCLRMNAYSAKLFETLPCDTPELAVSEDFLESAGDEDYCFVENVSVLPYVSRIRKLIIYRWNRHYPGDFFFDCDPAALGLSLLSTTEFAGTSHDNITREVYGK